MAEPVFPPASDKRPGLSPIICAQCGSAAERCERCGAAQCERRLCAELHDASCAAVAALPAPPQPPSARAVRKSRPRRDRSPEAERLLAEHFVASISQHRQHGRAALLAGDLDVAFDELWAARQMERDLDRLGASARACTPAEWDMETDLTPLARALSARLHPRLADAWRRVLDDRPARSVQAEAAEWLARHAARSGQTRWQLRILHAASLLGRTTDPAHLRAVYKQAGLDPAAVFGLYLAASHVDPGTARALGLRDPLTEATWSDQDARWWAPDRYSPQPEACDPQAEALHRARDLAHGKREEGWVLLAEADYLAGPLGPRTLGRGLRGANTDQGDEDAFVRIRLAYEGAAQRLPDVAWPRYRLAELLAWAGLSGPAEEHLLAAEARGLGSREADRRQRPLLRSLVHAALANGPVENASGSAAISARPFPAEPFGSSLLSRLRVR